MQWISISDYSIMYGLCEKKSYNDAISRIFKKNLMVTADSLSFFLEIKKQLKSVFAFFENEKPTDRNISISISTNKARIFINRLDSGLSPNEITELLDRKISNSLPDYNKLFTQYYNIENQVDVDAKQYLCISIAEELRKIIVSSALKYNFNPVLMDLGIFSAYRLLSKSFPLQAYEKWGVWNIGKENESQNLLMFDHGKFNFIGFSVDNNSDITIMQNTDPEKYNLKLLESLINKNYTNLKFDKFFVYTNSPNNIFVQNQIDSINQIILN